jgi:hypothetical protein
MREKKQLGSGVRQAYRGLGPLQTSVAAILLWAVSLPAWAADVVCPSRVAPGSVAVSSSPPEGFQAAMMDGGAAWLVDVVVARGDALGSPEIPVQADSTRWTWAVRDVKEALALHCRYEAGITLVRHLGGPFERCVARVQTALGGTGAAKPLDRVRLVCQ